jgi:prevent-host-death family protein
MCPGRTHAGTAERSASRTRHRILWVALWVGKIVSDVAAEVAVVGARPGLFLVTIYYDYGTLFWSMEGAMPGKRKKSMQEVAISEFKAKCLSLLEEVSKTRTPLRVTRRGKAIADVVPASSETGERSWIGSMSESIKIVGDIVSPVVDTETIEALKN